MFSRSSIPIMLVLVTLLAGCAAPELGESESALALEDIVAGEEFSRLKAKTSRPIRRTVEYTVEGRRHTGDLYLSPEGSRAGIVLVPGVVPQGKDDIRLVRVAQTFARLRFAVLVPEIESLRRYHTRADDVREVADAFRYLISRSDLIPEGRAGIAGFSYGGGIVMLAALEPDIREQVRYVMSFGGYFNVNNLVTYFTTGYYREGEKGRWLYRYPDPYLKWVFTLSNTDLVERSKDRLTLRDYFKGLSDENAYAVDMVPDNLAPDAQALFDLLVNEKPKRVPALIDKLSPRMRREIDGINPSAHDFSQMRADVILLHGRSDIMIPYTESVALAKVLPADQVKLFLIKGYAHTNVRPKREDLPQLIGAMDALLAQRKITNNP